MSWIIPCLLVWMIWRLFRRWHNGTGEYIELIGGIAMVIVFVVYMIGFIVGAHS